MKKQYMPGDIVLGNWTLTRLLGEGSFGRVFLAEREDFGVTYNAAVKIITIPSNESEIRSIRAEGMDEDSINAYFRTVVEEIVREFALMSKLKGTANIVSYEDHSVITHDEGIGWDILIRMELLTPLIDYLAKQEVTRQTAMKLGIDICRALELCQKFNIIHRDIKPENIFVSELGDFKLGDFGIARTVEKTSSGLSKKGTYSYMAPEVYREDAYGSGVDIYSLGIVLYRMLNDNRTPFLPDYPTPITLNDQETARAKRLSGANIPNPKNADGRLAEIVLKACAYDPKDRYSSPMQMREELEAIMYSNVDAPMIYPLGDDIPIKSIDYASADTPPQIQPIQDATEGMVGNVPTGDVPVDQNQTESLHAQPPITPPTDAILHQPLKQKSPQQKKKSLILMIGIPSVVTVIIAVILLITLGGRGDNRESDDWTDADWSPLILDDMESDTGIMLGEINPEVEPFDSNISISGSSDPVDIGTITGVELGVLPSATAEMGAVIEGISNSQLIDSIIWGEYTIYNIFEMDEFVANMNFETIKTRFHDNDEVTVLPFSIVAGPRDNMLREVSEQHPGYNWIRVGRFSRASKGQGNEIWGPNVGHYFETHIYHIDGDSLFLGWLVQDEATGIATVEKWDEIKFRFDGRDLILSRDGATIKLLTYRFTDSVNPSGLYIAPFDPGTIGWASDLSNTFHNISDIVYEGHGGFALSPFEIRYFDFDINEHGASVRFVDGGRAVSPFIEFFDDGIMTMRWSERIDKWGSLVSDEVDISARYLLSHLYGMILIDNNQLYFYQASMEEYNEARLGDNLAGTAANLEEEEAEELIRTQSTVLEHLQTTFSQAGINAIIDPISGRVTMESSILFGVNEYEISPEGRVYLDSFLDVYASAVLDDAFSGSISEIIVEGHTCTDGSRELNQRLSENRAAAVAEYALSRQPELAEIMVTTGLAYDHPVLDANGNEDKPASRRVVFRFILST